MGLKFFFLFLGLSNLILAKNNARMRFFNFWIFLLSFSEFSSSGRVWTEFGTRIFFSFSHPISPCFGRKKCCNGVFSIFLLFFFRIFCPDQVWTEFGTKIFFSLFRPISSPYWLKIMPEKGFLIFLIFFFYVFQNFLARVECERNSGPKIFSPFLGLSSPV